MEEVINAEWSSREERIATDKALRETVPPSVMPAGQHPPGAGRVKAMIEGEERARWRFLTS